VRRGEREALEPHATPVSATPRPGGRETGRGNARPKTASDPASRRRPGPIPFGGRRALDARDAARLYICDPCVVLASRIMVRDCDQDSCPPVRKSTAWDRLMARARQFWLALPPPLVLNQKPLDNGYFTP
jgi:hypothetical protein